MKITCDISHVDETLSMLRNAGRKHRECVVLWLGRKSKDQIDVVRVYRPAQVSREDMFLIPNASMNSLYAELRRSRYMVAAQIHSHPREAFHSWADDRWAIVRHEGALSLVVPNFANETTTENFFEQVKIYRFSNDGEWEEVQPQGLHSWLQLQ